MSNEYWDDEDTFGESGEGPKALRDALKKEQKVRQQLEEKLAELNKAQRERTVKEVLSSSGVNPAIAKFVPGDIADEDGVNKWLVDNASLFNITLGSSQEPAPVQQEANPFDLTGTVTPPAMSLDQINAAATINQATASGVPASTESQILAAIQNASSPEELNRLIYGG